MFLLEKEIISKNDLADNTKWVPTMKFIKKKEG